VLLDVGRHAGLGDRLAELGDLLAAALVAELRWIWRICSRSTISRWRSSIAPWSAARSAAQLEHLDALA
jgi:hypothetical protein